MAATGTWSVRQQTFTSSRGLKITRVRLIGLGTLRCRHFLFPSFLLLVELLFATTPPVQPIAQVAQNFSDTWLWNYLTGSVIGIQPFQLYLDHGVDTSFTSTPINGSDVAQTIAQNISSRLETCKQIVRTLADVVAASYSQTPGPPAMTVPYCNSSIQTVYSLRFNYNVNDKEMCQASNLVTPNAYNTIYKTTKILKAMMQADDENVNFIARKYFAGEDGTMFLFPATNNFVYGYDPRYSPWYTATAAPQPKDIVIIIDSTAGMAKTYGAGLRTLLDVVQDVASTIVNTANTGDRLGIISFSDDAYYPSAIQSCYGQELAVATPPNQQNLQEYIMSLQPTGHADFTLAFQKAFQLLRNTQCASSGQMCNSSTGAVNTSRAAMILFFTGGQFNTNETESVQTIAGLTTDYNSSIDYFAFSFGSAISNIGKSVLSMITALGTSQTKSLQLRVTDLDNLRFNITDFYSVYAVSGSPEPIFTPPFTDAFGLGSIMSVCLPVIGNATLLIGVTCVDILMDSLFSEIAYFDQDGLSYAFLIDDQGHALMHPFLPEPSGQPLLVDILALEVGEAITEVRWSMISGAAGSLSAVASVYSARGDIPPYGVDTYDAQVTYSWHPIYNSGFSLCIVLGSSQERHGISWNSSQIPPVQLCYSINLTNCECMGVGGPAVKSASCINLAPRSYIQPFAYLENDFSADSNCSHNLTNISLVKRIFDEIVLDL